jgi:transcriptional regulator with XRE-family HTH domain
MWSMSLGRRDAAHPLLFHKRGVTTGSNSGGTAMLIGERIRQLREEKDMSQGEIQKRTGLLRCHISRVENGRTVPGIETLEKMARALDVPLYRLFYDGEKPPELDYLSKRKMRGESTWGTSGREARFLLQLRRSLGRLQPEDRQLLLSLAQKMAARRAARKSLAA